MKKYKIGEVSKIVNVPVETIRFFEQKGLIQPEQDVLNKYRYYDQWDIRRLFEYKKFRDMGFTQAEALDMIDHQNFRQITEEIKRKQSEAENLARYYEIKALKLQKHQNILKNIPLLRDEFTIVNRPEGYYVITQEYKNGELRFLHSDESSEAIKLLMDHYTFVEHVYRIKQDWFEHPEAGDEFQWGHTIKKKWVEGLGLDIPEEMEVITRRKAVYGIVYAEGKEEFSVKHFKSILQYMKDNGYALDGDILEICWQFLMSQGKLYALWKCGFQ